MNAVASERFWALPHPIISTSVRMKSFIVLLFFILVLTNTDATSQSLGIGATSFTADTSALFEMRSTSKGLLIPRMSEAQRLAIVTPAAGLLVYQSGTADSGYYYWNGAGWRTLLSGLSPTRLRKIPLVIVAKGAGSLSTITVAFDNVHAQAYAVNDELYFAEPIPLDYACGDITVTVDYISMASETNRFTSWNCIYKVQDGTSNLNGTTGTLNSGDLPLSPVQHKDQDVVFTIPAAQLTNAEALHFKIKRVAIAAGSNPSANPAVVHVYLTYSSHL